MEEQKMTEHPTAVSCGRTGDISDLHTLINHLIFLWVFFVHLWTLTLTWGCPMSEYDLILCSLSRWSWSGLVYPLSPPPMERSNTQTGAWLWAGAWVCSSSSGSLSSQCISCWGQKEVPGWCVWHCITGWHRVHLRQAVFPLSISSSNVNLNDKFPQKWTFSHYLLTHRSVHPAEVKFLNPRNVSRASLQNSMAANSLQQLK